MKPNEERRHLLEVSKVCRESRGAPGRPAEPCVKDCRACAEYLRTSEDNNQ